MTNHKKFNEKFSCKIAYLSLNSSFSHSSLAFAQLKEYTRKHFPKTEWFNLEYTAKDNSNVILKEILKINPSFLVSTAYLFNTKSLIKIIRKIKILLPDLIVILGGPEFLGNNNEFLLKHQEVTAVFRGDETSFPEFLSVINKKNCWYKIKGLCFLNPDNNYIDCGTSKIEKKSLDILPPVYNKDTIPCNKPFIQLETSRGCYSKCSFCTSSLSGGVSFYSLDRIKSDLNDIKKLGYKEVRILDRTFNLPANRAVELLKTFINDFPDIKFHIEVEPYFLTPEIIEILKTAKIGQFHIEAGIQTFHKPSLEFIKRNTNTKTIKENLLELCKLTNIKIHTDLIYGLPLQPENSVYDDLNILIEISPEEIQLEVLKILPGTKIIKDAKGIIKYSPEPPYEVLSTSTINIETLIELSYLSRIIDCYYNVAGLCNIIKYASASDPGFLKTFTKFSISCFSRPEKPSLKTRFNLLFKYAETKNDELLSQLIYFVYLKSGFFNSENIKSLKRNDYEQLKNNCTTLWKNSDKQLNKPAYLAEFNCDIAMLWSDRKARPLKQKSQYLFELSQSGLSKKVSRISKITGS